MDDTKLEIGVFSEKRRASAAKWISRPQKVIRTRHGVKHLFAKALVKQGRGKMKMGKVVKLFALKKVDVYKEVGFCPF